MTFHTATLVFALLLARPLYAVAFEENRGQLPPDVLFRARGLDHELLVMQDALVFSARPGGASAQPSVTLRFAGISSQASACGDGALPGVTSYFLGNDPSRWVLGVRTFRRVHLQNLYAGLDLVLFDAGGKLEMDVHLESGAALSQLELEVSGLADEAALRADGSLALPLPDGELALAAPAAFQGPSRLPCQYRAERDGETTCLTIHCSAHDERRPLVVDPIFEYSTYLGGVQQDFAFDAAVDASDNAYVLGRTYSSSLPGYMVPAGAPRSYDQDCFVSKLDPGGTLIYTAVFGGSLSDIASSLAVDSSGRAHIAGSTYSSDFPLVAAAASGFAGERDGFLVVLDASGANLVHSCLIGGSSQDDCTSVDVDGGGASVIAGTTASTDLPTTAAAFQPVAPVASTPSPWQPELNGFVVKIPAAGGAWDFCTYFGGTASESIQDLRVDGLGRAVLGGWSNSTDLPRRGAQLAMLPEGAFVAGLTAGGDDVTFSTQLRDGTVMALALGTLGEIHAAVNPPSHGVPPELFKLAPQATAVLTSWLGVGWHEFRRGILELDSTGRPIFPTREDLLVRLRSDLAAPDWTLSSLSTGPFPFVHGLGICSDDSLVAAGGVRDGLIGTQPSSVQPAYAGLGDACVVRLHPREQIEILDMSVSTYEVHPGDQDILVSLSVRNPGPRPARIDAVDLSFRRFAIPPPWSDITADYTWAAVPGNPQILAAGAAGNLQFCVDAGNVGPGNVSLTAILQSYDPLTGERGTHAARSGWSVPGELPRVSSSLPTQTCFSPGDRDLPLQVTINNPHSEAIIVDGVSVVLSTGPVDFAREFAVTQVTPMPVEIPAGATSLVTLRIDVAVDAPAIFSAIRPIITLDARVGSSGALMDVTQYTDFPTWSFCGCARILAVTPDDARVVPGDRDRVVHVLIENSGTTDVEDIDVDLDLDIRPWLYEVTPDPSNPTALAAGAQATFDFSVDFDLALPIAPISLRVEAYVSPLPPCINGYLLTSNELIPAGWTVCRNAWCGDCNYDGHINIVDALIAAIAGAGVVELSPAQQLRCNVAGAVAPNPSATVDVLDALALARAATGLPVTLACCQ